MPISNNEDKYSLNENEKQLLDEYANILFSFGEEAAVSNAEAGLVDFFDAFDTEDKCPVEECMETSTTDIATYLSRVILSDDDEEFYSFVDRFKLLLDEKCKDTPTLREVIELGLRHFVSQGNDECACLYGALLYSGMIFEQDYARAKEVYETAVELGSNQALINLGYIYEYGRVGKPDYNKAYEIFARAAALEGDFESYYKLGDMYSRGRGVEQNLDVASSLWLKSYEVGERPAQKCHSAFRLAKAFISDNAEEYGLDYDPMAALVLFQEAEVGYRIEIHNDADYYKKNLAESIEGQEMARKQLENDC